MSDGATRRLRDRIASVAPELDVREVEDADGPALTALIGAAYDEYDCGPMDPIRFDADLAQPRSAAVTGARRWWVVTRLDGAVVASVALGAPHDVGSGTPMVELHRLYLAPEVRGRGLATALLDGIVEEAVRVGAVLLIAWSDTRLVDAHRRYLASGFTATGETRELGDPAGTTEARFTRTLGAPPA
jgi:GNAT superfamily N-acetyltransferase